MIGAINVGFYNALKLWPETWVASTVYTLGDIVKPTSYTASSPAEGSRYSYKCTARVTDYKSGASEPTWGTTLAGTTTDNKITWTCYDGKCYNVKSPQGSTMPYVTFGLLTDAPIGTFADMAAIENLTFWVNAFSGKSSADVCEMGDEILVVMDNASLTVTGYTNMVCRREFIGSVTYDLETDIFQIPFRYRVYLDKS